MLECIFVCKILAIDNFVFLKSFLFRSCFHLSRTIFAWEVVQPTTFTIFDATAQPFYFVDLFMPSFYANPVLQLSFVLLLFIEVIPSHGYLGHFPGFYVSAWVLPWLFVSSALESPPHSSLLLSMPPHLLLPSSQHALS